MVFSFFKKQAEQKPVPEPKVPEAQALRSEPPRPQAPSPAAKSPSPNVSVDKRSSEKTPPVVPRFAAAAQAALANEPRQSAKSGGGVSVGVSPPAGGNRSPSPPPVVKPGPAVVPRRAVESTPVSSKPAPSAQIVAQLRGAAQTAAVATPEGASSPVATRVPPKPAPRTESLPPQKPPTAAPVVSGRSVADFDLDDDLTLTESVVMNADADADPVQADVEQVVIMYADGRDSAARVLLEKLIPAYSPAEGKKLWLLLFDLLQIQGDRAGFDRLCLEFARVCETSPPSWRDEQPKKKAVARPGSIALSGILTADDTRLIREIRDGLAKPGDLNLDCSRWMGCDDSLAGQIAELLQSARRHGKTVSLVGIDAFLQRLDERLEVGAPEHEPSWRLLLELLQRYGTQERFEERAVDYAVSFELSPPSWEPREVTPSQSEVVADGLLLEDFFPDESDGAHCLSGNLVNHRFEDIQPYLVAHDPAILDFSAVTRVDFFSAGQLVNRLAPLAAQGRQITIQHPNRLVCGLLQIVGLDKYARIVTAKA